MIAPELRRGAAFAVLAAMGFSLLGICVKTAAAMNLSNEVMVFFRNLVCLSAVTPLLLGGTSGGFRTSRFSGHLWRASFGICAIYCFFYALTHLPLATAMLLTYSTPLYVPFIAWYWIGEKPPVIVFPAALTGLVGIGFIVQPSADIGLLAGVMGILSGMFAAGAMVSIRRISDTEPAARIVFYFSLIATLASLIPLLWAWRTPTSDQLWVLVAGGLFAAWGQLAMTRAYAEAPAARIGPFIYLAVIFSALLSWLIWDETLDRGFVIGALLVVATCVMVGMQRKEPQLEE